MDSKGLAALAALVGAAAAALLASHRRGPRDGLGSNPEWYKEWLAEMNGKPRPTKALPAPAPAPKPSPKTSPPARHARALAPSATTPVPVDFALESRAPVKAGLPVPADLTSWVRGFDVILINTSAGKDSQAMMDYVYELARKAGVESRIVAVHCDLGRAEWQGTKALAQRQAEHYGMRFEVVRRERDLLHQVELERKKWPDSQNRYCTSDQKTSQVVKLITRLVRELDLDRPARILNCLGLRAQESPGRAKKPPLSQDSCSNGKRDVLRWLPIHAWTEQQVWQRIKASGVDHHYAYDLGMPRLSCVFCVLASKSALMLAAQHNPQLADEYIRVERAIGHRFTDKYSFEELVEAARKAKVVKVEAWIG